MVAARAVVLVLAGAATVACLRARAFPCASDVECVIEEAHGACVEPGFCAYADDECASALRYGPAAGDGLAHQCVEAPLPIDTTDGDATTATTGCGACDAPPTECFGEGICDAGACTYAPLASGTACAVSDPCTVQAECDGDGACVVLDALCDEPPGTCHASPGVCSDGMCTYLPRPLATPCEDGDGCTLGDACDGAGTCTPGPLCPTENPCAVGTCTVTSQCSFFPVADATACGAAPSWICCAGTCLDSASDDANCGGCGVECMAPSTCTPAGDSGACTG